jgi:cell division septum initiation protein DivIVA
MPDVQGKLDEIITMVETAKGKALSGSSAVIDRAALLASLEELRNLLPAEMSQARSVLRERSVLQDEARAQADEILLSARTEADRVIAEGRVERDRLVGESEVVAEAQRVAAEITEDAETEAIRMRDQTDDYIDGSLARFQQLLSASLETVSRGRARVAESRAEAEQYDDDESAYAQGEQLSWTSDASAPGATEQDYVGEHPGPEPAGGYVPPPAPVAR